MKYNLTGLLFLIYYVFCFILANGQVKKQVRKGTFIDTSSTIEYDWKVKKFGFHDDPERDRYPSQDIESELNVVLDTISKTTFNKFKGNYKSKIEMDTSMIVKTDSSIAIKTDHFYKVFPSFPYSEPRDPRCNDGCESADYGGLLRPLNLLIMNVVNSHEEVAYTYFIDRKTGKSFLCPTDADEGPAGIIISPDNKFLLTYSNSSYEHDNVSIYILKINQKEKGYTLDNYLLVKMDYVNIDDLVWVDEHSFALSVKKLMDSDENKEPFEKNYYLKISIHQ